MLKVNNYKHQNDVSDVLCFSGKHWTYIRPFFSAAVGGYELVKLAEFLFALSVTASTS